MEVFKLLNQFFLPDAHVFFKKKPNVLLDVIKCLVSVADSDVFLLIQESKYQTQQQKDLGSLICSRWTLQSHPDSQTSLHMATLSCISHTCLTGPCLAIPHDLQTSPSEADVFAARQLCSYEILCISDRRREWPKSFVT
jgi:hypothetical protein